VGEISDHEKSVSNASGLGQEQTAAEQPTAEDGRRSESDTFPKRLERRATNFARATEIGVRTVSYVLILVGWFVVGGTGWLCILVVGMPVLLFVIFVRLIAGLGLGPEIRLFFKIMRFWPNGFAELARSHWSEPLASDSPADDVSRQVPHLYSTARILYAAAITWLLLSLYKDINPITSILGLSSNVLSIIVALIASSLLFAIWRDYQGRQQLANSGAVAPSTSDNSVQHATTVDSVSWTGRGSQAQDTNSTPREGDH